MKTLVNNLLILFLLLFSLQVFAQSDTSKQASKHPLLDKYYPRAQTDTLANTVLPKSTGILKPSPVVSQRVPENIAEKKPLPSAIVRLPDPVKDSVLPVMAQGPVVTPNVNVKIETGTVSVPQSPVALPVIIPEQEKEDSILPISTEAIGTPVSNTQMVTEINPINTKKEISPVTTPTGTAKAPEPKKTGSKPEPKYNRARLGSSSPLYRTWEKNNNGAGSVTTLPKG